MSGQRPLIVTAALPYANGPLHFGHIAGAYLPADLYVRTQRLVRGLGVEPPTAKQLAEHGDPGLLFISGTDEHGVAITINAEKVGQSCQEYVDGWYREIRTLMERFAISFDHFSRTTNREPHYRLSQEFFLRLLRAGNLSRQNVKQHFSPKTQRFLADRYVQGTCYLCGHDKARGDECPKCGSWLEAIKLLDPVAAGDPDDKLELRDAWQFELEMTPISADEGAVRKAYGQFFVDYLGWMKAGLKTNVRATMFDKLIEGEGMRARPITRDLPWGVPLPETDLDGTGLGDVAGKVLYVWFDAPIGYVSATIEWARDKLGDTSAWRRYWIAPSGAGRQDLEPGYATASELVHFLGKDNIPFHTIVFPAMLAGQAEARPGDAMPDGAPLLGPGPGERWVLPDNVPANEFYNLEGRKFSTSENWVLDIEHMFDTYGVDALRWYLTRSMPETSDTQFTFSDFQTEVNVLADVIGNYASRSLQFTLKRLSPTVPPKESPWNGGDHLASAGIANPHDHYLAKRQEWLDNTATAIGRFNFRNAAEIVLNLGRYGNQQFDLHTPWKLVKTDEVACASCLNAHLQIVTTLSVLIAPFMPGKSRELRSMLNLPPVEAWTPTGLREARDGIATPDELLPGHTLGQPGILFAKIPDELVEQERARLGAMT